MAIWVGRSSIPKNYTFGSCNWVRYYLGDHGLPPTFLSEIQKAFCFSSYQLPSFKAGNAQLPPGYVRIKIWIGGRRPGKPTSVIIMNCLQMLSSGNSTEKNDNITYMAAETGRWYAFVSFEHIYAPTYMTRWPSAEELVVVEIKYRIKGFTGCRGSIQRCKVLWNNLPW